VYGGTVPLTSPDAWVLVKIIAPRFPFACGSQEFRLLWGPVQA